MRRLSFILALTAPGLALAHGGHAPAPEAAHGLAHAGPWTGLALVALVAGAALLWRARE